MPMMLLGPWPRCRHPRITFPLATAGDGGAAHVTCLDCGREFWYDWERMRRGAERLILPQFAPAPGPQPRSRRAA